MTIIGIDPGYAKAGKGCALAVLGQELELIHWCFVRPERLAATFSQLYAASIYVVVEKPQFDGRTPAAMRTTLELAWQGSAVAYYLAGINHCQVTEYEPRDWKGSARKPQHHAEIWRRLFPNERTMLGGDDTGNRIGEACTKGALDRWSKPGVDYYSRSWLTHNILDAVGLALKFAGRLK